MQRFIVADVAPDGSALNTWASIDAHSRDEAVQRWAETLRNDTGGSTHAARLHKYGKLRLAVAPRDSDRPPGSSAVRMTDIRFYDVTLVTEPRVKVVEVGA